MKILDPRRSSSDLFMTLQAPLQKAECSQNISEGRLKTRQTQQGGAPPCHSQNTAVPAGQPPFGSLALVPSLPGSTLN